MPNSTESAAKSAVQPVCIRHRQPYCGERCAKCAVEQREQSKRARQAKVGLGILGVDIPLTMREYRANGYRLA